MPRRPHDDDPFDAPDDADPHADPHADPEGPSAEDLARFSASTVPCPECGAEVYDESEWCPRCGHAMGSTRAGGVPWWIVGVAVLVASVLVLGWAVV